MDIIETINKRKSVRTFDPDFNNKEVINDIRKLIEDINIEKGPFKTQIHVNLVVKSDLDNNVKLGTYGVISGANYYLLASSNKDTNPLDFGYLFEKLILKITSIGLGTVWMAGTYRKKDFVKVLDNDEFELKVIAPFGPENIKTSPMPKIVKKLVSSKRNEFDTIFFKGEELEKIENEEIIKALTLVQKAPSSLNKQPWRIVVSDNTYHFYCIKDTEGNRLDLGIAFSHLDLYMKSINKVGTILNTPNDYLDNYIFSVRYE